ncbi:MAG: hypothetical protein JST89_25830 [Cyanobacteria bacterium SZAS-4]|nr:hypothetical protein [Cyanobacteria bacterium SZAS-4]
MAQNFTAPNNIIGNGLLAQAQIQDVRPTTIIPTDLVPLPAAEERETYGDTIKLKVLQVLPAKLYFNANCETSFRNETNVFQTLMKRQTLRKLDIGPAFYELSAADQAAVLSPVKITSRNDNVFRVFPNVTAGWAFTPRTRVYSNYFFIRDNLFHNPGLNTNIQSIGGGIQHDIPLGKKANLQGNLQFRELYQTNQISVFDYLPGLTLSYYLTPRTVLYTSALLQMRGKRAFCAPTREIDPFYTFGGFYQKGLWSFSATGTFLQNFREPFRRNALIPINNYSWILDFELDRQLSKKLPGAQVFVRAEPIYNFHSRGTTGLSGVDFRIFYGLKVAVGKQPLTSAMQLLRDQLQETSPAVPKQGDPGVSAPSTSSLPRPKVAHEMQPIHGVMNASGATNAALPAVQTPLATASNSPSI